MEAIRRFWQWQIVRRWNRSDKIAHKVEAARWVLYIGVPVFFYKVASAENIFWWYDKVDQGPLKQVYGMRGPEEHYALDKASRDDRAKQRDERIAKKIAEREAAKLKEQATTQTTA